jgi:hypothetical protein
MVEYFVLVKFYESEDSLGNAKVGWLLLKDITLTRY